MAGSLGVHRAANRVRKLWITRFSQRVAPRRRETARDFAVGGLVSPAARRAEVKVELAGTDADWGSATMSDGWVVVVDNTPRAATTGDVIRSITYSDADGSVVVYRK